MKKQLLNLCLSGAALMFLGTAFAQNLDHPADTLDPTTIPKYQLPTRSIEIPAVCDGDMNVDGFGDESAYSPMQTTHLFNDAGYTGDADFKCDFKVAWSASYIYFYTEISDDVAHEAAAGDNTWEFDNWEIFIDIDTSWTESQWTNGADPVPTAIDQFRVNRGALGVSDPGADAAWLYVEGTNGSSGWSVECAMPWTAVSTVATLPDNLWEKAIGFDVSGADSDGDQPGPAGARDVQTSWDTEKADNPDNAWYHRNVFGLVNLEAKADCSDGFEEVTSESTLVYPNPATDVINVNASGTYEIYTIAGQLVKSGDTFGSIDIAELNSGVYVIKMETMVAKFVK